MNRRHGMEGAFGIGGGDMVTKESENSLNIARDLIRRSKTEEALPHLIKALKDPNNTDAMIEMAFICPNMEQSIATIEAAEVRGKALLKEKLGATCFENGSMHVGKYWDILETRPYMRVLQAMERLYFETKKYHKATVALEEMLRLRPGDNLSARKSLGTSLIRNKRYADALSFVQQWLKPTRKHTPARGGTIYSRPSSKPYAEEDEKNVTRYKKCLGDLLHTAALASFKYSGDCPQSRQYLRWAAKVNPHILLKILGKKTRPVEHQYPSMFIYNMNGEPRMMNGPEDAHDYLWYGQDLWMTQDVWNWANSQQDVKEFILKKCSNDGCDIKETEVAQFKRCSACHLTSYCGAECQKADWKKHKPDCKAHQELKATIKSFNTGRSVPKDAPNLIAPDFNSTHGLVLSGPKRRGD